MDPITGRVIKQIGVDTFQMPLAGRFQMHLAILKDGSILTYSTDIQIFSHLTGELIRTITFDFEVEYICFLFVLDDGNLAVGFQNGSIIILDITTGTIIRIFGADIVDGILKVDDESHRGSVRKFRYP